MYSAAEYVGATYWEINKHLYKSPSNSIFVFQGDTPKNRAEKAKDSELAAYLENRQHYQMIQREDQETAV